MGIELILYKLVAAAILAATVYFGAPGCQIKEDYTTFFGQEDYHYVKYLWYEPECKSEYPHWKRN
jgi:hypothetical protein